MCKLRWKFHGEVLGDILENAQVPALESDSPLLASIWVRTLATTVSIADNPE